jgi:hypothetical protein
LAAFLPAAQRCPRKIEMCMHPMRNLSHCFFLFVAAALMLLASFSKPSRTLAYQFAAAIGTTLFRRKE